LQNYQYKLEQAIDTPPITYTDP